MLLQEFFGTLHTIDTIAHTMTYVAAFLFGILTDIWLRTRVLPYLLRLRAAK